MWATRIPGLLPIGESGNLAMSDRAIGDWQSIADFQLEMEHGEIPRFPDYR
jgi:hypothetical protein